MLSSASILCSHTHTHTHTASYLQGQTLHSFAGIPFDYLNLPQIRRADLGKPPPAILHELVRSIKGQYVKLQNFESTEVLILDEVSMIHPKYLSLLDALYRWVLRCVCVYVCVCVNACGVLTRSPPLQPFLSSPPTNTTNATKTTSKPLSHAQKVSQQAQTDGRRPDHHVR